jgi:anti-sigma B factor antagonist
LVFDLTGVSFADSAGISSLVMACKRVRAENGTFSMTGCQNEVLRVLEISGLIDYLDAR